MSNVSKGMEGLVYALISTPAESLTENKLRSHNWAQEKYKTVQTQLPVASKPALMTRFASAISIFTTAAISIFTTA